MKSWVTSPCWHCILILSMIPSSDFCKNTRLLLSGCSKEGSRCSLLRCPRPILGTAITSTESSASRLGPCCSFFAVPRSIPEFSWKLWSKRWRPWAESVWEEFCRKHWLEVFSWNWSKVICFYFSPVNSDFELLVANGAVSSSLLNILSHSTKYSEREAFYFNFCWIRLRLIEDWFLKLILNHQKTMEADPTEDILGPKKRNYQFLQYVRDKNYPEALLLGKLSTVLWNLVLKDAPDNPSVRKFV